jgi:hypothetical protein
MTSGRVRGDSGQVAGIEVLPFGVLIFVIGSLIATNAWAVVDAKIAAGAAAREAARAYVEAPDGTTASWRATQAARETIDGYGRNPDRVSVSVAHEGNQPWRRCVRVTVTVRYPVHTISLPGFGGYGDGLEVRSAHGELIDPYRSGLPADGSC